ncbi:MAG: GGDEF domain-containing protein [Ruminococcus sp.]|nr:GGDEF domain-containing protein [Ruminococcus sp.]
MTKREKKKPDMKNVSRLKFSLIIGYAVIVIAAVSLVSALAVKKTDTVLKNQVSTMVSSLNVQMKLNMNSYLFRMETIGTLAFAEEEACTYDATSPDNDEYEALNTEKIISDKLYSLCIMENFVDYGIVYRNNHYVGKISNGTANMLGDKLFEELSTIVSRQRTKDGWAAGFQDNFKRIYYVKQIHENALLVISFYAAELENVFDNPETLNGMEIRLINQNYDVIYSSENYEVGEHLNNAILERVQNQTSVTVIDNEYVVAVNPCGDEWNVICSVPTEIILSEKNRMQLFIYMIGLLAALLAAAMGAVLSVKIANPVTDIVSTLDTKAHIDQLTGILNKLSFEEYTGNRLADSLSFENHALILIDVDNFKGVNDTLGHAYGDKVLSDIGALMRSVFPEADFLGRVGGDEFAVFINSLPGGKDSPYPDYVQSKCEELCEGFRNHYTGDDGNYKISASIGVSFFPEQGQTFPELYARADKALYFSKHKGKDTYTFFSQNLSEQEANPHETNSETE